MRSEVSDESRPALARSLLRTMLLIREFETVAGKSFAAGEIPGFIHLSIGQEAVAAGVCAALRDGDKLTSTHRGHGHCLARGSDPGRMMAEIFGRETGLCRGRGGTMHLYDLARGVLGTNGIVAAGGPLACGAALAAKISHSGAVVVSFMGDGATDQGATHESMNLASVWSLPVIFVVENNGFSEGTPLHSHTSAAELVDRAQAYSMPGIRVDGQDALAVHDVTAQAVAHARQGHGPTLIEAMTSRFRGHFEGDTMKYRRDDRHASDAGRDPVELLRAVLRDNGWAADGELDEDGAEAVAVVAGALEFARQSPRPRPEDVLTGLFATAVPLVTR